MSLSVVNACSLADHVPLDGSTTLLEIADRSGLPVQLVERFIRHAMSNHIFTEEDGLVRHTASSRLLATLPDLKAAISMMSTETWPAVHKVVDVIKAFPQCEEPNESAYSLAHEPGVTMFAHLAKHPKRMDDFGTAMGFFAKNDLWNVKHLVNGYPWSELDHPGTVLVDVGGGQGSASKALASTTKHIKFIVQDQQISTDSDSSALSNGVGERIEFMQHDFFTEQPIKSAQVYFFRWILHDWSDKYAARILKNLVPAMQDGTKVILFENILKDGPETKWTGKQARCALPYSPRANLLDIETDGISRNGDLVMLAHFNGRERTPKAFEELLSQADPRFSIESIRRPPGSVMAIIEVVWKSDTTANPSSFLRVA